MTANLLQAFYSRPATCDYLRPLDEGMSYSLPALLLCDELRGELKPLTTGRSGQ